MFQEAHCHGPFRKAFPLAVAAGLNRHPSVCGLSLSHGQPTSLGLLRSGGGVWSGCFGGLGICLGVGVCLYCIAQV